MTRLLLVAAAVMVVVSACGGASSGDVTMTWTYDFEGSPWQGPVTLAGSAVDDDVVCAEGEGVEQSWDETASDTESVTFTTVFAVTCADESGDFVIQQDTVIALENGEFPEGEFEPASDTWTVLSGTGDYTALEGGGENPPGAGSIDDANLTVNVYTGELTKG